MTPFPRGKAGNLSVYLPRQSGGFTQRSCKTTDAKLVKAYEAAVHWLQAQTPPAWDLIDALAAKRLTWSQVMELHAAGRASLAPIRAKLEDVALLPKLPAFRAAWLADGRQPRTLDNYEREIGAYLATYPMRSDFTPENVQSHLRGLSITPGSRRKHLYALRAFERYLCETKVMTAPMLPMVRAPKKNRRRLRYESAAIDAKITAAVIARYRPAVALIHATGADVSSILTMRGRDLDLSRLLCHIPGTKSEKRYRHDIPVEAWAAPFLAELKAVLPDGLLFPGMTRHKLSFQHARARKAAQVSDYTLRDARHTIAVMMRRKGQSFEAIAARLGNSVYQCAITYAAFTAHDMAEELASTTTDRTTRGVSPASTQTRRKA